VDGVVTLKGLVDAPYQKLCAEADVKRVPGVQAIRNQIAVKATAETIDRRLS
jgi:osmotically-inducible protein OsmY